MPELEDKIAAWRAHLSAALPGREETVRELEAHLRDHIDAKTREGMPADAAFAQGVARMGEPRAIAREFDRAGLRWFQARPIVVIYALVGSGFAVIFGMIMLSYWKLGVSLLVAAHVVTLSAGYLAMIASGLVGLWTIVSGWRRPSTQREIQTQRREIFRMAAVGSVAVPVGILLGMVWAAKTGPFFRAWSWAPVEVGALSVLVSSWLLLLAQVRLTVDDRVRGLLALIGASVVSVGWFAKGLTSIVPIGWLCTALILSQGAIALLHVRSKRAAEGERPGLASD